MTFIVFFSSWFVDHLHLHVRSPSFPPRRSSVLIWHGASSYGAVLIATFILFPGLVVVFPSYGFLAEDSWYPIFLIALYNIFDLLSRALPRWRSEEHTSELQSLMRNSYAAFFLKKKILP